ncbi:MAG: bifunctional 2-methylcitrate dehydratase/aconitate hydratase [Gammaproteobacteria bacterium]|nr:bifunctional 2-methylcitrate dehydratase/aconitate hydratase [Gammaproteobacteria bacterium]
MADNLKPAYDDVMLQIADYVLDETPHSKLALETARLCLMDSLGCAILALSFPACRKVLGPVVPGAVLPGGVRIPGLPDELDPVQAAFNIGTMVRWLDFNDTWLAAEWGHPSDNLGAILSVADYVSRQRVKMGQPALKMHDVLNMMIKAYEIQGCFALENSFNRVGLDHVILVKLASTAVACVLLGCNKDQVLSALSQVFVDGQSLRTYRHSPNTGSRKSWAAGDATARAVRLALFAQLGEMGYPSALTAKTWGFYDVLFQGQPFKLNRPFGQYVMEHILFKLSYPAEFHAQTAVECAVQYHAQLKDKLDDIERIELTTHESAMRIISKTGPLHNPADRDHCLQYMVAIGLIFGTLTALHYEDEVACDPRIDLLRSKMQVKEDPAFSKDYLDPNKRSIANRLQVVLKNGQVLPPITVEYPIGHRVRREEGIPVLLKKCRDNLLTHYSMEQTEQLVALFEVKALSEMSVDKFMAAWGVN